MPESQGRRFPPGPHGFAQDGYEALRAARVPDRVTLMTLTSWPWWL
ncbi:hypothetical protein ACWDZ8_05300 [Streptomyces sp. NPDC003233]